MNKIVYVIALVLGLTISTRINAQETIDLNISQGNWELLKNLACTLPRNGQCAAADTAAQ